MHELGDEGDKYFPESTTEQAEDAARRERLALERASKELDRIPEVVTKLGVRLAADEAARREREKA